MTIGSAISGIGGLIGSSKAADTAQSGAQAAAGASQAMFNTGAGFELPWVNQGAAYRAPINDVLLGGSTGSGTYAGGGVNDMVGGAGARQNGFGQMYNDPFLPQANMGTNMSTGVPAGTGGTTSGTPLPGGWQDYLGPGPGGTSTGATGGTAPGTPLPGGWQDSLGYGPPSNGAAPTTTTGGTTPTTTTGGTTPTTTTDPNAVQGTAYTGPNILSANEAGTPAFGSTSGGAGYGTVGLGRVNLNYSPTDWNTFAANYSMSPAAQYQMGIGDASVNNSAAAKGGLLSSADLRSLMTTNAGIASQDMYRQYGSMLQGQQQDYAQRLASMGLLQSQEAMGANAANTVMGGASASGGAQSQAIAAGSTAAARNYANMFSGFGSGGQNLFGSGGIFSGGSGVAA